MNRFASWLAPAVLLCSTHAALAVPLTADLGYTVDQDGGDSLDLDLSMAPTEHLTLYAGAGKSRGSEETSDLSGALYNVAASLHGERAGVSLSFDAFHDSSDYQADTFGARAWYTLGDFELALLGRRRDLSVAVTLELPLRTVVRDVEFSANGAGLQLTFMRGDFTAYAMGLAYDYGDDFDEFIELINSDELVSRPRIEALVGSFVTQTQGTIDRQLGAGVEFALGRQSLAVDCSYVHDAMLDAGSTSLSLTWRHTPTAHFDWALQAGVVDSDAYGSIGFLGVQAGLAN